MEQTEGKAQIVIAKSTKSAGLISRLLTFLFGLLGMLYANVVHAIIIVIAFVVGAIMLRLGALITWPISYDLGLHGCEEL